MQSIRNWSNVIHEYMAYIKAMLYHVFLCNPLVCRWMWDNLTCWQPAEIGQVVWMPCPELFDVMSEEADGEYMNNTSNCEAY